MFEGTVLSRVRAELLVRRWAKFAVLQIQLEELTAATSASRPAWPLSFLSFPHIVTISITGRIGPVHLAPACGYSTATLSWCLLTVNPKTDDDHQSVRSPVSVDSRRRATLSDESIGAVVGALATLAVLLFVVAGLLAWRRQRQFGVHRIIKCLDGPLQVTSATTRPPASPGHCTSSQLNGAANGLAVAAKVLRFV